MTEASGPMNVVIPFTAPWSVRRHYTGIGPTGESVEGDFEAEHGLRPEVEALALEVGARLVDVSGDDQAYWRLLRDYWAAGETFIVVEHDVLPTRELLESMWQCPEPLCTGDPAPGATLQCVKFAAALIGQFPTLLSDIGPHSWQGLDLAIEYRVDRNLPIRHYLCGSGAATRHWHYPGEPKRHMHGPPTRHLSVPPTVYAPLWSD
jgi:hypothetical protein